MTTDDIAINALRHYTACDVSDALLKLKVANAGFIPDLSLYTTPDPSSPPAVVTVAPVSTVLFAPKSATPAARPSNLPDPNIPKDVHWADLTQPDTLVVLQQPPSQANAICGGIMALRIKVLRAKGIVVAGRIRDLTELQSTGLPVWARGTSTVGAGGGSTPWATQVPLDIDGTAVAPGDLAVCDSVNGVVVIPGIGCGKSSSCFPSSLRLTIRPRRTLPRVCLSMRPSSNTEAICKTNKGRVVDRQSTLPYP
uniref:4-hydroxy-4-methyl-2-oxoglutarate aldolase n=1 Tax=Bionectria ochroleuca TaxID=29856 RepID=A0A8H7NFA8_BIOOC